MNRFFAISFILGLIVWSNQRMVPPSDREIQYENISLGDALILLKQSENIVVDARENRFYIGGHIPNSINLPASAVKNGDDLAQVLKLIRAKPNVIVYCDTRHCGADILVSSFLVQNGIDNVKVYSSGYREWKACGLPIESTIKP